MYCYCQDGNATVGISMNVHQQQRIEFRATRLHLIIECYVNSITEMYCHISDLYTFTMKKRKLSLYETLTPVGVPLISFHEQFHITEELLTQHKWTW